MSIWQSETSDVETLKRAHAQVHRGNLFSANHLFTGIADGSAAVMWSAIGSKEAHFEILVKSTGQAEIEFEQNPTFTGNGTEVPAGNRNMTSSKTAITTIYHTPVVDASGSVTGYDLIAGGGDDESQIGGETRQGAELIVGPNTNHLLRVTNTSGSSSKILVEFVWYEE